MSKVKDATPDLSRAHANGPLERLGVSLNPTLRILVSVIGYLRQRSSGRILQVSGGGHRSPLGKP